jgi:FOG: PKD repeat
MIRRVLLALVILAIVIGIPVLAIPPEFVVDFSANVTNGTAPLTVQFNNLVSGSPVHEAWCIAGVWYNQSAGPLVVFPLPGVYDANLTVTDDLNLTLTAQKTGYVRVFAPGGENTSISFIGSGIYGSNPIEIIDNVTGEVVFEGSTASRNVQLDSNGRYLVRIEPGGLSDILNCPDYGLYLFLFWVRKNMLGVVAGIVLVLIGIGIWRSKTS